MIVSNRAQLAPLCVICSRAGERRMQENLRCYPWWAYLLPLPVVLFVILTHQYPLLVGGSIVAAAFTRRKGTIGYWLCEHHVGRRARLRRLALLLALAAIPCVVTAVAIQQLPGRDPLPITLALMALTWASLIAAALVARRSRVLVLTHVRGEMLIFKGAGDPFLETLPPVALRHG